MIIGIRRFGGAAALVSLTAGVAAADVNVVTTTETLAALTRAVGGDRVTVEAIARGYQDPHYVEAKPSFILKLYRADLLILVGRDLEVGWLPPLITQSRNRKIQPGAEGYLDASLTAAILEIPRGQITRAMGDVHPLGNPHYLLGPSNGRRVAKAIQQKLTQQSPDDAAYFAERYGDFDTRLAAAEARWDARMAPYRGVQVVTYHRSWSNFTERFNLDVIGYVEPRPGIPPSPAHILTLIQEMRRRQATSQAEHLQDMLVGSILSVSWPEVGTLALLFGGVGLFHYIFRHRFLQISLHRAEAAAQGVSLRRWDFLFYASFGLVVTSAVGIAGVLLVFCYLIVPSVGAMLYADQIGPRLAIGWTMGAVVSALGVLLSLVLDLPTGATLVCTFGLVLLVMALARPWLRRTAA